jgi:hypothetical protein
VYGSAAPAGPELALADVGSRLPGVVVHGAAAFDGLGTAVSGGLDVNADGVSDAIAGAPQVAPRPGASYVLSPLAPEPVDSLVVERRPSGVWLEWEPPHRAAWYDVYLGSLGRLDVAGRVRTSGMAAGPCGTTDDVDGDGRPDAMAAGTPAPGETLIYLVTSENLFGESALGPSRGAPSRVNDARCP